MTQISDRRAHTRERLGDAALAVFAERGVLAASVEEICERAGFTRGAFYSNYSSKDDLCIELLRRVTDRDIESSLVDIERIAPDCEASIDFFAECAAAVLTSLINDRTTALFYSEVQLYAARSPAFAELYRDFRNEQASAFVVVMQAAVTKVGRSWRVPERDAFEVFGVLCHQLASQFLITQTHDREWLLRILRPLMRALLT